MNRKIFSLVFASLSFLAFFLVAAINFFIDPFTYYHRPWISMNLSKNLRHGNPGIARQFDYRIALVGTSHVMELESSELSRIFGEPGINFSTTGSLIREQSLLAGLILEQGKAHTILWEMNYPSFEFGDTLSQTGQEFPMYLYCPSVETPFRYLVSGDTLAYSYSAMESPHVVGLDTRYVAPVREFSEARVLENWDYQLQRWNSNLLHLWAMHMANVEAPRSLIEKRIVPLLQRYPEVQFKLFFPPTSALTYLHFASRNDDELAIWLEFRNELSGLVEVFHNLQLFDFQSDWNITSDLDLFRDMEHFNRDVLESMFERMSVEQGGKSREEILRGTHHLREQLQVYGRSFCRSRAERCPGRLKSRLADSGLIE